MNAPRPSPPISLLVAMLACAGLAVSPASLRAQEAAAQPTTPSEPAPSTPAHDESDAMDHAGADGATPAPAPEPVRLDERGRRIMKDEPTVLAFRNVTVDQVVPFIVESTGKVVLPQRDVLGRPITIINDQPIPREKALDLVFFALQQANVAVVETSDLIILRDLAEIDRQDVPVVGPGESVLTRTDLGTIVEKVFELRSGSAANVGEMLKGVVPNFAKLNVDADSNQIVVMGNIGLLQRLERLITALDQPNAASLVTETFHLRYADATAVATNIRDLFSQQGNTQGGNRAQEFARIFGRGGDQNNNNRNARNNSSATTSQNLRVTANTQQNSVTVLAERPVLDQIRDQIMMSWDKPLPEEAVVPRIYDLKNSDPIKIKDLLTGLFGRAAGQAGQNTANTQGTGRLAGQFSFEAIPEKNQLVVVGKSPDNMAVIDKIINDIDRPQTSGLPRIVELKHASAEELADQLNALLSQEGTLASIPRQESGLSQSDSSVSPFATQTTQGATNNQNNAQSNTSPGNIQFWWQRARPPTTTAGSSNLVSKARIVPVWRQNALLILAPAEYQESLVELVTSLDKPGRQVLLSAVIAEINLDDLTALGLRWSSQGITPTNADNSVSLGAGTGPNQETFSGQKNNLLPGLFDTSVLDVGVNLNLVFQALSEKTKVNILSEPRIFTSDNQEAEFFSGQDIPFIDESQTTDNGTLNQTFDYRAVGISLRARPRITINKDVDLRINLELSSIQPNQTLFGGFIVDRRETTTHLIVRDGQTVVVSGILRSEDSDIKRKVPLLGDIPLLGAIFTSTEKTKTRTELVAFVTPIVIENPEDAAKKTKEDAARLEQLRREMGPDSLINVPPVTPDASPAPADQAAPDKAPSEPAPHPLDPASTPADPGSTTPTSPASPTNP